MKNFAEILVRPVICVLAIGLCGSAAMAREQAAAPSSRGQTSAGAAAPTSRPVAENKTAADASVAPRPSSSVLVIGSGDEVQVTIYGAPDLSGRTRVGSDGNISLPLVGYVHVAGLTTDQAQNAISQQLRGRNIIKDPQVSVFVKEYTNSEISVAGEVVKPGVFSALGPHRLLDVLEEAGGPTEKASDTITISHSGTNEVTTVHLSNDAAQMARSNLELHPGDTVVVPKAGIVYVLGEVYKPGGYVMNSSGGLTVLQVISAAGGPTHLAAISGTKMVRRTHAGLKEIRIPLKDLLRAKVDDFAVTPGDVLYIPSSRMKSVLNTGALLSSAGAAAVYRLP